VTPARKVSQESNARAAWIILNDPARYPGLPLLWAEAWVKQHGLAQKPAKQAERRGPAGETREENRESLVRK
jgi:hypothetical protein